MGLAAATPESASAALAIALAVARKKGKPRASPASRAVLAARVIAKTA
jgi:hypothetical protein